MVGAPALEAVERAALNVGDAARMLQVQESTARVTTCAPAGCNARRCATTVVTREHAPSTPHPPRRGKPPAAARGCAWRGRGHGVGRWLAVALASLAALAPAAAHESEQYTLPVGREFADLGPHFSRIVHRAVADAAAATNAEIAEVIDAAHDLPPDTGAPRPPLATLQSQRYIAMRVWSYLFAAIPANELLDLALQSQPLRDQYPGLVTLHRPDYALYDDPLLLVDLTKFVRTFFRAGTVDIDGTLVGTDKLVHFLNVGRIYHVAYLKRVERGASPERATQAAIAGTSRNPLFSEDGVLGTATTGIRSNGDLAADYAGLLFYRNLTEPVRLGARTQPPMLVRDGPYWRVAAEPDSDFFTVFVTPHWNEVLNPNRIVGYVGPRLRTLVRERCPDVLDFYRDPQGRRMDRAQFEAIERELSTVHGVAYDHRANARNPVSVASVCFAGADAPPPVPVAAEASDAFGRTPLWWAAHHGRDDEVRHLLPLTPDVDAVDVDGESALHAAARRGHAAVVGQLLAAGALVDRVSAVGATPLALAAAHGRGEAVAALLGAGADPNARHALFGTTALHAAALRGHARIAEALLRQGADPRLADDAGHSALQLAASRGDAAMVDALRAGGAAR